ncbi:putative Na+/H+ antiporter [Paracoccus sp. TOH]|uniref:putative Na+/H+ antiporter n=1 Tax=Paracoccus sp. TOH TaxID=1263728 RepID=UPI0025B166BB|nr:putative Na+/H+ antiporter [Paracoccus sp. TOH]WJS87325.1 hypothetical protein NBE95_20845 [Paracoccus sp. TOH]
MLNKPILLSYTAEIFAACNFAVAILLTRSTKFFEHLAHTRPSHAGIFHLLGEVEVAFAFWEMVPIVGIVILNGQNMALTQQQCLSGSLRLPSDTGFDHRVCDCDELARDGDDDELLRIFVRRQAMRGHKLQSVDPRNRLSAVPS